VQNNGLINNCTGVILAGGENRRMPVSKAFITVDGYKIIERAFDIMRDLFSEIFIVTNRPEEYVYLKAQLLGDAYKMRGPMTGIFTALLNSSNQWVFVAACDMPFMSKEIINYAAAKRCANDAVVVGAGSEVEPLFAFYARKLVSNMEQSLLSGKRGMKDFLNKKKVKYIKKTEIKGLDLEGKSFVNLNTPEDIELYLQLQDRLKFQL